MSQVRRKKAAGSGIIEVPKKYRSQKIWIVTYDLPSGRATSGFRKRFYRALRKWLREHPQSGSTWMALSTVITMNKAFADFLIKYIDDLRLIRARASMYEAHLLRFTGKPVQFTQPTVEQSMWMMSREEEESPPSSNT